MYLYPKRIIPVPKKQVSAEEQKINIKETRTKIVLEGEDEYIKSLHKMMYAVREFREELEQLNGALEKEIELLKRLD